MNVAQKYAELLTSEGYRPIAGEDSSEILFKVEGITFRVVVYEDDPEFVAVTLSYGIQGEPAIEDTRRIANEMNANWKVVKTCISPAGDAVRFNFETFAQGTLAPALLRRAVCALRAASDEFFAELRNESPQARA